MRRLYELLKAQVKTGKWWPGDSRFEIAVGAVLVQNTTWANVERAIQNLNQAGLLDPNQLLLAPDLLVRDLIRPAGYFNTKTGYLKELSIWFLQSDQDAQQLNTQVLREQLLKIRGIGEETADDLLLYIYQRPVFIYDLYARRLLAAASYGHYQTYKAAKRNLDPEITKARFSVTELNEFHALIVESGKIARKHGGWSAAYPLLETGCFG